LRGFAAAAAISYMFADALYIFRVNVKLEALTGSGFA